MSDNLRETASVNSGPNINNHQVEGAVNNQQLSEIMSESQRLRQEIAELIAQMNELRRENADLRAQLNEVRDGQRSLSWQRGLSILMILFIVVVEILFLKDGFEKYPSRDWVPAMSAATQSLLPLIALLYARQLRYGNFQSNRNLPEQ